MGIQRTFKMEPVPIDRSSRQYWLSGLAGFVVVFILLVGTRQILSYEFSNLSIQSPPPGIGILPTIVTHNGVTLIPGHFGANLTWVWALPWSLIGFVVGIFAWNDHRGVGYDAALLKAEEESSKLENFVLLGAQRFTNQATHALTYGSALGFSSSLTDSTKSGWILDFVLGNGEYSELIVPTARFTQSGDGTSRLRFTEPTASRTSPTTGVVKYGQVVTIACPDPLSPPQWSARTPHVGERADRNT